MNLKMLRSWLISYSTFSISRWTSRCAPWRLRVLGTPCRTSSSDGRTGPSQYRQVNSFLPFRKYFILEICHIWFKQCAFYSEHNFQKYTLHCSWHTHIFISIYTIDLYGKFEFTLSFILCSKKPTKIIFGQISNYRNLGERKKYNNFSCSESFSILLEPFWRQALWQQI